MSYILHDSYDMPQSKRKKIKMILAQALCNAKMVLGFAEVRRFIAANAIKINGNLASAWNEEVHPGDIINVGKKIIIVGE